MSEERRHLLARTYFNPPGLSGLGTVNSRGVARRGDPQRELPRERPRRRGGVRAHARAARRRRARRGDAAVV